MNLRRLLVGRIAVFGLACVLGTQPVKALTVYFGDIDRGPSVTLQIGGVSISDDTHDGSIIGQPTTLAGYGLGSSAFGPYQSIDRQQHYSSGDGMNYSATRESLSLSVDGKIDSITIVPYFSILNSSENLFLPFDISYFPHQTDENAQLCYVSSALDPMTISFEGGFRPSSIDLGLSASFGDVPNFYDYLSNHSFPDITFQFGYTVQSIDYTPAIPEPGALSFLSLVSVVWFARRIRNRTR